MIWSSKAAGAEGLFSWGLLASWVLTSGPTAPQLLQRALGATKFVSTCRGALQRDTPLPHVAPSSGLSLNCYASLV